MRKHDYPAELLAIRDQSKLHTKYLEIESSTEKHRYHPVLMYLLLHPRTKRYNGTLAWVLTQTDPIYYFPVFIHLIRTLSYEPSLWIYEYLIDSISKLNIDERAMLRAMATDASENCKARYKRIMFAELIGKVIETDRTM